MKILSLIFVTLLFFVSNTNANNLCSNKSDNYHIFTKNILSNPKDTIKLNYDEKLRYKLSGKIMAGENPLPAGKIFIFENAKGRYETPGNTDINNGNFTFDNLNQGNYTIYAIPEQNFGQFYYPKYIPTYSFDTYNWENSNNINLNSTNTNFVINLISYNYIYYGHGAINGLLYYSDLVNQSIPFNIILLNENKVPLDFKFINPNQTDFSFENLPAGTYYIYPEKPGFQSVYQKVVISENTDEIPVLKFNILEDIIELIKEDVEPENPVEVKNFNHYLLVKVPNYNGKKIVCEIIDASGKFMVRTIEYSSEFKVNTTNTKGGIYFVRIKSFDNNISETIKVFINN